MAKNVLEEMRETLIESRIKEENKIDAFGKSLSSVDVEEVFGDTYIPPVFTLKALCPEAYKDNPDVDVYNAEFDAMCVIMEEITNKIMSYNEEAIKCMQEYKMMS